MTKPGIQLFKSVLATGCALAAVLLVHSQASAQAVLTTEPITWNIIGLDSNDVDAGPNDFPVGTRVCNTGDATATNVVGTFNWNDAFDIFSDDGNPDPFINLRAGTLSQITLASLANGSCSDMYFEAEVTRDAGAYDNTREYFVNVTADSLGTVSTPQPRELFVEHLISQNRNTVSDLQLDGVSIAEGGTLTLAVGETYEIKLFASTATQGYEQIETFINFPNTIFQTLSVETTYTADTSATVSSPSDKLYGDACAWDPNPNSPNYLACDATGKVGGTITVTYQVLILEVPAAPLVNPEPLSTLVYDFSGSSFHYNSDYGVSTRYGAVIDPTTLTIDKNFSPNPTNLNGVSVLTFTITNPNSAEVGNVNFADTLPTSPGNMVVANPTGATTTGCGSATFAPTASDTSLSFSGGTIAANGSCTVSVNVNIDATGSYVNISDNLFVGSIDTGDNASDTLVVNTDPTPPACTPGLELATWTMEAAAGTTVPPAPTFQSSLVSTATASFTQNGSASFIDTVSTDFNLNSWAAANWGVTPAGAADPIPSTQIPYFEFELDTSNFTGVAISYVFELLPPGSWAGPGDNRHTLYSSTDGATWSLVYSDAPDKNKLVYLGDPGGAAPAVPQQAITTGGSTTYFRVLFAGGTAAGTAAIDDIVFTGCGVAAPPTLTKTFSPDPVAVGGTSTLTFTMENNNNVALTDVTFTDDLPSGVAVAGTPAASTTCSNSPTWAPSGSDTTLTFGSPTGATIPARTGVTNVTCTAQVDVVVSTAGPHNNVSSFISSAQSGVNDDSTGIATDSITAVLPPSIEKLFGPNPILENGVSTLTFTITNPNLDNAISGIAFSDTYPSGVVNTNPTSAINLCGGMATTFAAGGNQFIYGSGSLAAGASCTIAVDVTSSTAGDYTNTSGNVSHVINSVTENGDTATDTLTVNAAAPAISILKQVGPTASGPFSSFMSVATGADVYYLITIENTGDAALTTVDVTDPDVSLISCLFATTLPVADANDDDHIDTCVVGPITALAGSNPNTATVTADGPLTDNSTATYATTGLTLDKTVAEADFLNVGDELNYSYLVTNSGSAALEGPVTVIDDRATVTCPALATVGDGDDFLDPAEAITCTATYTIILADITAGSVTNIATATVDGVNSPSDTVTVGLIPVELLDFTIN